MERLTRAGGHRLRAALPLALAAVSLAACSSGASAPAGDREMQGSATVTLTQVPENVACIDVNVVGARSADRRFPVKAGQSTVLTLNGLPTGDVVFYGSAFDGACGAIGPGASPSWVGDPVSAQLSPGVSASIILVLRSNGRAVVSVDFQADPTTGGPCVGDTAGCLSPADVTGTPSDPPPDGAIMVAGSDFLAGLQTGALTLTSTPIQDAAALATRNETEANRELVMTLLADRPDLLAFALATPVEDATLRALGDGNFLLHLAPDSRGIEQDVVTMGESFKLAGIVSALTRFPAQQNQLGMYETFFAGLPPDYLVSRGFPSPRELEKAPAEAIARYNQLLVADLPEILKLIQIPAFLIHTCAGELGTPPNATDQYWPACSPSPASIFAGYDFPLKTHATCVKNQGHRGTCVSFGITGATEAKISVKHAQWVNLSEERLYYWAKVPTAYGDGLDTDGTLNGMISTTFRYPWEFQWDYNPSYSRIDHKPSPYYTQSCVGYSGEHCSDTAHQGDMWCVDIPIFGRWCAYDGSAPSGSGYGPTFAYQFFNFGVVGGSAIGRLALALKTPLVMSFEVTPSFDGAAPNGVVTYVGPGETSRGGHATAVMGFVDNAYLPPGIPPGSGGGYFIVKNSWGSCWKDGGYVYLPYDWVEHYAYSLISVGDVN
jgi:hypothetical protein